MIALVFKLLVATSVAALGAWTVRLESLDRLSDRRFLVLALGVHLGTALLLFVALYGIAGQQVTSDVPAYYVPAGRAILNGQLPFRDFMSSYAPLFPYLSAGLLWVWNDAKAFVLLAFALDAATLLLWHEVAIAVFDRTTARQTTVLFAASGQLLVQALLGTNQCWIAAGIAGSALLLVRARSGRSGALQGLTVCCVKILAVLFWPVLWMLAPRRLGWLAGALLPAVVIYGWFALSGADVVYPLVHEGELISSGNLPYLLGPLLPGDEHLGYRMFDAIALLVLALTSAWLYFFTRRLPHEARLRLLIPALALTELVFMLFSKKSFPGYALFCLYPLTFVLVRCIPSRSGRLAVFSLLNVLLATESSLWFDLGGNNQTLRSWIQTGSGPGIAFFLVVEAMLIAGYVYLGWLAVGWIRSAAAALPLNQAEAPGCRMQPPADGIAVNHVQGAQGE